MKKILFLGHRPPPFHGAASIGNDIYNHISLNNDVRFIKVNSSFSISDINKGLGIHGFFFNLFLLLKVMWVLIVFSPGLIYTTPSLSGKAIYRDMIIIYFLILYSRVTRKRILCHIHMQPLMLNNNRVLKYIWMHIFSKVEVILLSSKLAGDYGARFNPKLLHILPNYSSFSSSDKTEYNEKKNIVYIGHISQDKGAYRLLELAKECENDNFRYLFAGEFSDLSKQKILQSDIENYFGEKIKFLGRVEGEKKKELFSVADVLVIPSYSEAMPLTIIESLAVGLPIVATNTGAISEMIDESVGFCCDFSEFKTSIETVIRNGRYYYSNECKFRWKSKYTRDVFIKKLDDIFELRGW